MSGRWSCTVCGREALTSILNRTVSDRYRSGHCLDCKTVRMHQLAADPTPVADPVQGERLKAEGMASAETTASLGTDAAWQVEARRVIASLAAARVEFTANDVTARAGLPSSRNAVGAMLSGSARRGTIVRVGYQKGDRASQHARVVAVWKGTGE